MIVTCPRCFSADDVVYQRLPDRMVEYTCSGRHDGAGSHIWLRSQSAAVWTPDANDGVTDELLDPLLACVVPGESFVEYGVVEYRFRLARPDLFVAHVRDRGHVMLAPGQATASSVRFATALGRLARSGELVSEYGPATGAWRYNSQVTYWARPPAPHRPRVSWSDYCAAQGRSDQWTDEDRSVVQSK
jgi:hypothetical protein